MIKIARPFNFEFLSSHNKFNLAKLEPFSTSHLDICVSGFLSACSYLVHNDVLIICVLECSMHMYANFVYYADGLGLTLLRHFPENVYLMWKSFLSSTGKSSAYPIPFKNFHSSYSCLSLCRPCVLYNMIP